MQIPDSRNCPASPLPSPRRTASPEPVFGITKLVMGFRRLHPRGLDKVKGEWNLVALGLEREADVRSAARLIAAVLPVRRTVRRPCRGESRHFLAPSESFCLSNLFAAVAPVETWARRKAASSSMSTTGGRGGPRSDRLLARNEFDPLQSRGAEAHVLDRGLGAGG